MFSPAIVESDAFLEMPPSSQALYFHLGMYADDDGFVNPQKIMRMMNASGDDLKVLIAKRFVLPFENGVVVIKHWRINNLIRKDFYRPTQYVEQFNTLTIKENGAYTDSVNKLLTTRQRRIGKDRIGKVIKEASPSDAGSEIGEIINLFKEVNPSYSMLFKNKTERGAVERLLAKMGREKLEATIAFATQASGMAYAPTITTPYQLEKKLGELVAFYKKQESKGEKTKVISIL